MEFGHKGMKNNRNGQMFFLESSLNNFLGKAKGNKKNVVSLQTKTFVNDEKRIIVDRGVRGADGHGTA